MKPSFTPCSFSKRSLCRARNSCTAVRSTSLNEVSSACVDCASTMRCAMRCRRRVMATRCSPRALAGRVGAGTRAVGAGAVAAATSGLRPRKSTTSDFVSRPSRPLPGMLAASRRFSSISRRTDGLSFSLPPSVPVALSSCAAGAAWATAGAATACAWAPSSTSARICPAVTTAPGRHFQLPHHAVGGRGHFEHHLVGLEVGEVLVALDRIARLLVPGDERRVGDGLRKLAEL